MGGWHIPPLGKIGSLGVLPKRRGTSGRRDAPMWLGGDSRKQRLQKRSLDRLGGRRWGAVLCGEDERAEDDQHAQGPGRLQHEREPAALVQPGN